jgi:hypothetical protein
VGALGQPAGGQLIEQLSRDVGINIAANLIANLISVAVLYLAGVVTGLLAYSASLVAAALMLIIGGGAAVGIIVTPSSEYSVRLRGALILAYANAVAWGPGMLVLFTLTDLPRVEPKWLNSSLEAAFPIVAFSAWLLLIRKFQQRYHRLKDLNQLRIRRQAYQSRPHRRRASREPRIVRRQRL